MAEYHSYPLQFCNGDQHIKQIGFFCLEALPQLHTTDFQRPCASTKEFLSVRKNSCTLFWSSKLNLDNLRTIYYSRAKDFDQLPFISMSSLPLHQVHAPEGPTGLQQKDSNMKEQNCIGSQEIPKQILQNRKRGSETCPDSIPVTARSGSTFEMESLFYPQTGRFLHRRTHKNRWSNRLTK